MLTSVSGEYKRKAWTLIEARPQRLYVFLDAEFYLNRMDLAPLLPAACVFVSHENSEVRQRDYICNPRYAEFIARDAIDWAHKSFGSPLQGNLICGLSLSGLAGAHMALLYPDVFTAALCQSGSFWWCDEWLLSQVQAPCDGRFWLSVGDKEVEGGITHPPTGLRQEASQLASVSRMEESLREAGAQTHLHIFEGGHEMGPWEAEIPDALRWLTV